MSGTEVCATHEFRSFQYSHKHDQPGKVFIHMTSEVISHSNEKDAGGGGQTVSGNIGGLLEAISACYSEWTT